MDRMCLGNFAWTQKIELTVHFTRAPGDSPLNTVERTFAPLTRAMANQIYSHNFYGEHLNSRKQVVDPDLCLKNFTFSANRCARDLRSTKIHGRHAFVSVQMEPAIITFFNGAFTSTEYETYLHQPTKLDEEKRKIILIWENWLMVHSQSSWYRFQVRLCNCTTCPKNRPYEGFLEKVIPQLAQHKNFLPTPQKDDDSEHFSTLEELLDSPYVRPDTHLPENPAAQVKPIFCADCDTVCTSQKDFRKHKQALHNKKPTSTGANSSTAKTGSGKKSRETKTGSQPPETTSKSGKKSAERTPKKSTLKRSRSEKKSPEESSPKKKVCFSTRLREETEEELLHNDNGEDSDEYLRDSERITKSELDFFYGSTTFGRQVKEIGDKRKRKSSW